MKATNAIIVALLAASFSFAKETDDYDVPYDVEKYDNFLKCFNRISRYEKCIPQWRGVTPEELDKSCEIYRSEECQEFFYNPIFSECDDWYANGIDEYPLDFYTSYKEYPVYKLAVYNMVCTKGADGEYCPIVKSFMRGKFHDKDYILENCKDRYCHYPYVHLIDEEYDLAVHENNADDLAYIENVMSIVNGDKCQDYYEKSPRIPVDDLPHTTSVWTPPPLTTTEEPAQPTTTVAEEPAEPTTTVEDEPAQTTVPEKEPVQTSVVAYEEPTNTEEVDEPQPTQVNVPENPEEPEEPTNTEEADEPQPTQVNVPENPEEPEEPTGTEDVDEPQPTNVNVPENPEEPEKPTATEGDEEPNPTKPVFPEDPEATTDANDSDSEDSDEQPEVSTIAVDDDSESDDEESTTGATDDESDDEESEKEPVKPTKPENVKAIVAGNDEKSDDEEANVAPSTEKDEESDKEESNVAPSTEKDEESDKEEANVAPSTEKEDSNASPSKELDVNEAPIEEPSEEKTHKRKCVVKKY